MIALTPLARLHVVLLSGLLGATAGAAQQPPPGPPASASADSARFGELMRSGRYSDALRVSQLARAAEQTGRGGTETAHRAQNLHRMVVAASYDGQSEVAIRAARDLAELAPEAAHHLPLVFARFGQWEEIIRLPVPQAGFQRGMLSYAWGLATLRIDGPDAAFLHLTALQIYLLGVADRRERLLLETASAILSAEIEADVGEYDAAVVTLEAARELERDSIPYAEPEDWIVPVRHVLGAILLDAGRADEAERVYRDELEAHPENGWSLYGLALALRAQRKTDDYTETLARYDRAWARADVGLRGSRF